MAFPAFPLVFRLAITFVAQLAIWSAWVQEVQCRPYRQLGHECYRQSEYLLSLLGLRRVEERVRGFLELLAQDYGQPCDEGLRLNLRLTHQEMASALSTTRVTVTRVIGLLRDEGWLKIDAQRHLVITHLPKK